MTTADMFAEAVNYGNVLVAIALTLAVVVSAVLGVFASRLVW